MSTADLGQTDTHALVDHEAVIERGLNTFVEVGTALVAIRAEVWRETVERTEGKPTR